MKSLLSLAKRLDFTTEYEYFDYCIDSYLNGNFSQCKALFKAMCKADRLSLIRYVLRSEMLSKDKGNISEYYLSLV